MLRQYTKSQLLAIQSGGQDICVSAGAGSGKTGVLVSRFVRIVTESLAETLPADERASVSEILVVTFTDRATKEMKSRIFDEFNARNLVDERRSLETAYISTIHSLCARLLKENPFEAGVDPRFTVLDEPTAHRLLRQAFDRVISGACSSGDEEITGLLSDFVKAKSFQGSDLDAPVALAAEAEAVLRKMRGAGITIDQLRHLWQAGQSADYSTHVVRTLLHPTITELSACILELRQHAIGATGLVRLAISSLLNAVGQLRPEKDIITIIGNVQSTQTATAAAHKYLGSGSPPAGILKILDRIERACDQASYLFGASADRETLSNTSCRRLLGLVFAMWNVYQSLKQESGSLDNEDLQSACVRLLEESTAVRGRCQSQFRYIMIDELQDTNRLQMRLIDLIHAPKNGRFGRNASHESETHVSHNFLFVVGDVQQSIYGFRNADPENFLKLQHHFRDNAAGLHIQLNDNFRSRKEILQLVTQVFSIAWKSEANTFVPLHAAAEFAETSDPSVEVLVSQDMARRDYVRHEADAIATRVKEMVDNHDHDGVQGMRITAHSHPRCGSSLDYGDIVVLLRGLTDVHWYEEAFKRHGVPAIVTGGGRGYYSRFEIQDLVSVLTLLDSPLDDVALLATLRSPFVGAEVDTLYRLSMTARGSGRLSQGNSANQLFPALRQLLTSPDLSDNERHKIAPFLAIFEGLQKDLDKIPVGQLIERLVSRTNYDLRLVCRPDGRRKLANVRKLIQIAHADPGIQVREFICKMLDLKMLSDREGDAPTAEEGAGVVRLMTIHSAKGSEFPVVILPDLSRGLLAPESGVFVCDPAMYAVGSRICGEPDAAYSAIVKGSQERDRSESLRVLYVALTRAQERVILCGNVGRNRGFNWADTVFAALGISSVPASSEYRRLRGGIDARITPILPHLVNSDMAASHVSGHSGYEEAAELADALLNDELIKSLVETDNPHNL